MRLVRGDTADHGVSSVRLVPRPHWTPGAGPGKPDLLAEATSLGACEARLERSHHRAPVLAVVGASYTAGVGPDNPEQSWAVQLARMLHWNAVVYGVPGAGYTRAGHTGRGPMSRMLAEEGLRQLNPSLVIVQAGHDDVGVPSAVERQRVAATINIIRGATPQARIALLTTFSTLVGGTPALSATDADIVAAARAADPGIIIMDPLTERWQFAHAGNGLHPTAGGDQWIARTVATELNAGGVRAARSTSPAPVICDQAVGVRRVPTTT